MKKRIETIIVKPNITIRQAMRRINEAPRQEPPGPNGILLVVDDDNKLIGVVTDGDIRRGLIDQASLDDAIAKIMSRNPITLPASIPLSERLSHAFVEIRKRQIMPHKVEKWVIVDEQYVPDDVMSFYELWKHGEVKTRTVGIVGLGYVGLTLALTFAESGFQVIGVDTNEQVIDNLRKGKAHFYEKGLQELLERHLDKNFTVQSGFLPNQSDVYIVCVGTPISPNKEVITAHLENGLAAVADVLKPHDLVVLRSTVPVGTCRRLIIPFLERGTELKAGQDFYLAFAPERTAEGRALEEVRTIPQIIGGYNQISADIASSLFKVFNKSIIAVSCLEAAEAVKLANNTYRDLIFAYSNELAQFCDGWGLDTYEIIQAANEGYPRGSVPLPSPGVGGTCLTKDPYIFLKSAESISFRPQLPLASRNINNSMIPFVANKVFRFLDTHTGKKDPKIFIMGLAFKGEPETSDLRDSTPLAIMRAIQERYPNVYGHDPMIDNETVRACAAAPATVKEGFAGADCVLVLNNHRSFADLPIYQLAKTLASPALFFDGWGMFRNYDLSSLDHVHYDGLGVGRKGECV